jgi:hypothetical protein
MNYRRKFQVAVGVAVLAVLIGMVGVVYSVMAKKGQADAGERETTVVLVKTEGGKKNWDYSPDRNPSYMGNTSIQQVGYLTMTVPENEPSAAPTILPLFGYSLRYKHSDRWVYFTATDKYQSIRLPVEYEKRDCMNDDVGCRELYTGDVVRVPSYEAATFTVTVYKNTF